MPVFRNRTAFELTRSIKAFLNIEAGVTRGEVPKPAAANPGNFIWVFGAGRTGSTWLAAMMGEVEGHHVWFEPRVGELFNPERMQIEKRAGKSFIFASQYKKVWLKSIKSFVLEAVEARYPGLDRDGHLVIKEPAGSEGAPMLMEAMPESRMILLIRDPRDVAASWLNASRKGGWQYERRRTKDGNRDAGRTEDSEKVRNYAKRYRTNVGGAKKAYDAHKGPKTIIKYEDLRADTLATLSRAYSELGVPVDREELSRAVEKHSWENIPEDQKGEGKFYRKASPGGWQEDLTPEQIMIVEKATAPLLEELYPEAEVAR
ncbi:MAG: sulfotransferase [Rubrobacteraceae bacterium]